MTTPADRIRAKTEQAVRNTAADICASFNRQQIPTTVAIAIAGAVVGQLIDQLPAAERTAWAEEFCACLLEATDA